MNKTDIKKGIAYWKRTGYGIDPNQIAFRHYPDRTACECLVCRPGLHPIVDTFADGRMENYPSSALVAQLSSDDGPRI